ncbi:MAG: hypothetical protein QMC90_02400 [Dehalococcoidales bacterium]|nr:hypothetical protein [Dehalococcoidales bacterium]
MREEIGKAEQQDVAGNLQEYQGFLRQIVLDIGGLIDRIAIDREADDPSFAEKLSSYLKKR